MTNKKYIVRLTDDERRESTEFVKKQKGKFQQVRRAQILLKADADEPGWIDEQIDAEVKIQPGAGNVVTGTFAHIADEVIDLQIDGQANPIGYTPNHPFWSVDRQDFRRSRTIAKRRTRPTLQRRRAYKTATKNFTDESISYTFSLLSSNRRAGLFPDAAKSLLTKRALIVTFP